MGQFEKDTSKGHQKFNNRPLGGFLFTLQGPFLLNLIQIFVMVVRVLEKKLLVKVLLVSGLTHENQIMTVVGLMI